MKKKNSKRIACIMPPTTLSMSALVKPRKLTPLEEWLFRFEDPIFFSKYTNSWVELSRIYLHVDGFVWLFFQLPFKLIKEKYSLFIAVARDPEGIVAFIVSKLLRKPIILTDTFHMWSGTFRARLFWPFSRFAASRAKFFTVSTSRVMDFWASAGVPAYKIKFVNAFVLNIEASEKNIAMAEQIKRKLGYKRTILFVGRLIEAKGLEYLIRAFARLSEVASTGLLIVGVGPDRERLEALCKELKLSRVVFTGYVPEEEKVAYYLLSDIFVLPSVTLKCNEEWGLVVNEAMSVGKPVIVSNSAGCAYELVKNGVNGYVVPEKNVEALYDAMKGLMTDEKLRIRMGREAEKTIKNGFTYTHAMGKLKRLLRDALDF